MLTPSVWLVLALLWLAGCALVVWLGWRAARRDADTQRQAESSETPDRPAGRDDRAA